MQWLKGKVATHHNGTPEKQTLTGGADQGADQGVGSSEHHPESSPSTPMATGSYEEDVLTGLQELVTIPGAIVHLIDNEESVHLASGDFSLVRLVQEKSQIAVIAKVGEELKWPLVQEESTVKLDPTHYFFTLKVPREADESSSEARHSSSQTAIPIDTLNYGLTLPVASTDEQAARIRQLDYFLEQYSTFSAPVIAQGDAKQGVTEADVMKNASSQTASVPGKIIPAEKVSGDGTMTADEGTSAAFWTTIAPNVDDYNSRPAKWIASGAGHVISDIFYFSDSTIAELDAGHGYMKSKFKPKKDPSKISPSAIGGVRSVRKLSGKMDKVVGGVLGGILYATGVMSSAVVNSRPGRAFFKTMPGEVALVSLDAFGTVLDAIEKAGTDVMVQSSSVTQDFVNYRYGESAKELADESFRSMGHAVSTVWSLAKIHKAFNPKGFAKSTAKSAADANKTA